MAKTNDLSNPMFHDADRAREWLEAQLWKDGPICPHCGVVGSTYKIAANPRQTRALRALEVS